MGEARQKQMTVNGNGATANASPAPAEANVLIGKMQMGLMALERELAQVEERRKQLASQIEEQRGALRMMQMLLGDEALQRELLPHLFEARSEEGSGTED